MIRTDKLKATIAGHIYSVVDEANELRNGNVGTLGDLKNDEREIYELDQPATADLSDKPVVLVAHPEVRYEEYTRSDAQLNKFSIKKGIPARAYELAVNDIFSTDEVDLIGASAAKGNYVVAENESNKLKEVASVTMGDNAFVGKVIGTDTLGTTTPVGASGDVGNVTELVEIQVIKNG